jgi:hypothetical protein
MNAAVAGTAYPLPDISQVRDLLGMLFDGLAVKPGAKLDLTPKSSTYFAVYVTDAGAPAALCACDIAFRRQQRRCALDAAAQRRQGCRENAAAHRRDGRQPARSHEHLHAARAARKHPAPAPRHGLPAAKLPAAAAAIVAAAKGRIDFEIGLGKYAGGLFAGSPGRLGMVRAMIRA